MHRYDLHRVGNPKAQWKPRLHDKALEFASKTECNIYTDTSKYFNSNPKNTIFIYKLSFNTTEHDLHSSFGRFGYIRNCNLVRDILTGELKRYAFIEYSTRQQAEKAVQKGNGMNVRQARVSVDFEKERTCKDWRPRRLGGGLGGNKKSGQMRFKGMS